MDAYERRLAGLEAKIVPGSDGRLLEVDGQIVPNYDAYPNDVKEGDVVTGIVVRIEYDEVLVDIGCRTEGVIPCNELSMRGGAGPHDEVEIGEEVDALVLAQEDGTVRWILSTKRARPSGCRTDSMTQLQLAQRTLPEPRHQRVGAELSTEPRSLLAANHWRAALVAAIAELEVALRARRVVGDVVAAHAGDLSSLDELINSASLAIDARLRDRLHRWRMLRNDAVHRGTYVRPASARNAVDDVAAASRALQPPGCVT